ncbi:isocitrate lyase/PEP mutase family protein [Micromonospora siamensis]|uniref:2-Methylisocitrate lyase, PEP mutase family n=1 Tax=Micromonospora siamensis TaxID=299152 RepID=A0A1C5K067_9ACTN|nr:isocitrate lyase/phosphoenolpyruvate mutase family protein [Micromonospora siamensis]SCG76128.1 2-Methylisocitrate lyase, PEP mutase family [Micromonospora siamensis]
MTQTDLSNTLRALHRPGDPLILPNAWDAGSARAVVQAGFAAVATSSGAVADSLGHADGEATPVAEMLGAIGRIAAAVDVPVTADIERGYGLSPGELAERLLATGAVGCNIEDSDPRTGALVDPAEQADLLAALRAAAGTDLVVNARIDVFLRTAGDHRDVLDDAVDRARRYLAAGADCVYPIFLADPELIHRFVEAVAAPVNVLTRGAGPIPGELAKLGVARVSYGAGLYHTTKGYLTRMIGAVRDGDNPYAIAGN